MIGILLAVLLAALVYLILAAITGSGIVAIVGAILVLIAGAPCRRREQTNRFRSRPTGSETDQPVPTQTNRHLMGASSSGRPRLRAAECRLSDAQPHSADSRSLAASTWLGRACMGWPRLHGLAAPA